MVITLQDLREGRVQEITESQFATLRGCSASTLRKERTHGSGPKFRRRENGKIAYPRESVLAYFDGPLHRSTSEYDTNTLSERMARARQVQRKGGAVENVIQEIVAAAPIIGTSAVKHAQAPTPSQRNSSLRPERTQ